MGKNIGSTIRQIRQRRKLTQAQMAKVLGYSGKAMISRLENDSADMSYEKLMTLISEFTGEFDQGSLDVSANSKSSGESISQLSSPESIAPDERLFSKRKNRSTSETVSREYEIVKFEKNGLVLDVNVSPSEETVWLSLNDICLLFGRDKSVISRHIKNIFKEGELLEKETVAKNATVQTEGPKMVKRTMDYYNLDVIISVGYRVKSENGIAFRKWANSVLKEYLIKGYAINEKRTLITNDNYANLVHRVENIDNRLAAVESKDKVEKEKIFFDGQFFDARYFIKRIMSNAKKTILLIDPYSDVNTLDFLKAKNNSVLARLYTSRKANITSNDVISFNKQYGGLELFIVNSFHDRFIIIDNSCLYHLGASLNFAGKRTFAITEMNDQSIILSILSRLSD